MVAHTDRLRLLMEEVPEDLLVAMVDPMEEVPEDLLTVAVEVPEEALMVALTVVLMEEVLEEDMEVLTLVVTTATVVLTQMMLMLMLFSKVTSLLSLMEPQRKFSKSQAQTRVSIFPSTMIFLFQLLPIMENNRQLRSKASTPSDYNHLSKKILLVLNMNLLHQFKSTLFQL